MVMMSASAASSSKLGENLVAATAVGGTSTHLEGKVSLLSRMLLVSKIMKVSIFKRLVSVWNSLINLEGSKEALIKTSAIQIKFKTGVSFQNEDGPST